MPELATAGGPAELLGVDPSSAGSGAPPPRPAGPAATKDEQRRDDAKRKCVLRDDKWVEQACSLM